MGVGSLHRFWPAVALTATRLEIDLILFCLLFRVERLTLFPAESANQLPDSLQVMTSLD